MASRLVYVKLVKLVFCLHWVVWKIFVMIKGVFTLTDIPSYAVWRRFWTRLTSWT